MAPLTFEEALTLAKLVDDWNELIRQMPTKQRNHMKAGLGNKLPHIRWYIDGKVSHEQHADHLDRVYAQLLHEASQL